MGKKVVVYSKPNCGYCTRLKMWLDAKEIEYGEVDITQDEKAYEKFVDSGRKTVPALEIDGEFVEHEVYNDILEML